MPDRPRTSSNTAPNRPPSRHATAAPFALGNSPQGNETTVGRRRKRQLTRAEQATWDGAGDVHPGGKEGVAPRLRLLPPPRKTDGITAESLPVRTGRLARRIEIAPPPTWTEDVQTPGWVASSR